MAYYIGLMSGTSMDGCDAALVSCEDNAVKLVHFVTLEMPAGLKERILDCCSLERSNVALVCSLNVELGYWFAEAVNALCSEAGVSASQVTAIGSHGQTVYHIPFPEETWVPSTLQLGEPAVIAYETGIPVVSSMRAMDIAAGGQGAPMVPFSEYLLYRSDEPVALQNIGGIGNVTVLPANAQLDEVFAFDTGPGNMIIDELTTRFFGMPYDKGGALAAQGQVDTELLKSWMTMPYVDAPPPKSTGRELYGEQFVSAQIARYPNVHPHDFLATATAYTAHSMYRNYELYVFPRCSDLRKIVLGGGGAHNELLKNMIRQLFSGCVVRTQEDIGWDSDAKEAIAFALIARETMVHRPGNVPSVTGASCPVPLGSITWPPRNA